MNHPFVVIEGPDGTGKTTLRKGLFHLWEGLHGVTPLCVLTLNFLDPGVTCDLVAGKYFPNAGNAEPYREAIVADKQATLERLVAPALAARPVIADRWLLSELAFFAVKHGVEPVDTYARLASRISRPADVTLVLQAPAGETVCRAHRRLGDATRPGWDDIEVQRRLHETYAAVVDTANRFPLLGDVVPLDARPDPAEVLGAAWGALDARGLMPQFLKGGALR